MGIDKWLDGDVSGDSDDSDDGDSSTGSTLNTNVNRTRWQTKIDFGTAYVLVAKDRSGETYVHNDFMCAKSEADDWRRLDSDFNRVCPECSYSTSDTDRLRTHIRDSHDLDSWDDEDTITDLEREYSNEYDVLFRMSTRSDWLRFCNLCQDQLGIDPEDVLEDDPDRLAGLEDEVYYPPKSKPDQYSTCQVCGASADDSDTTMVQMKLEKHKRLHVCADHTIEDLAQAGFLQ
jgi:hypothetical protein